LLQPTVHKRNICISDIHGCFDLLKELVEKIIRFDPGKDKLIFLGDYIDLSANSMKVVLYLQELKETYPDNIILLLGNHEEMAYRALIQPKRHSATKKKYEERWFKYGGRATLSSFRGERLARNILVPFIESLLPYYETDTHIFVHGGIPAGTKNIRNVSVHDLIWHRKFEYEGPRTLIVGHCPQPQVKQTGDTVCIDTGAYWYGKLSAYDSINNVIYEVSKDSNDRDSKKKMTYGRKILSHSNIT
jgi:serine/threonine protein phosphatase 1